MNFSLNLEGDYNRFLKWSCKYRLAHYSQLSSKYYQDQNMIQPLFMQALVNKLSHGYPVYLLLDENSKYFYVNSNNCQ